MSHTECPWEIVNGCDIYSLKGADSGDGVSADSSDGWHIASIGDCPTFVDGVETELGSDVKRSNANVLRMAPELLIALEAVVSVADRSTVEFDMARAAIAKARDRK